MGTHMKTTIEVSDTLFESAKSLAAKNKTTLRSLIEEGLRRVLTDEVVAAKKKPFKLKKLSVKGTSAPLLPASEWRDSQTSHIASRLAGAK
jgi:hypothetical protein